MTEILLRAAPRLPVDRIAVGEFLDRHPEWLALLVAGAGWVGLSAALGWLSGGAGIGWPDAGHHHPGATGPAAANLPAPHSIDAQLVTWAVMVLAMMLPTALPHLRYLGFNSRRADRQRTLALFTLGYLAVWLIPGLVLALLPQPAPPPLAVGAALFAGAWELTAAKRRALLRCCRTWPVRYAGPAADASAVEYGLRHGVACLLVSGPAMVALVLFGHPAWAAVALALLMAAQKLLTRPDRWRSLVAIGWLASGLAMAGAALLGPF